MLNLLLYTTAENEAYRSYSDPSYNSTYRKTDLYDTIDTPSTDELPLYTARASRQSDFLRHQDSSSTPMSSSAVTRQNVTTSAFHSLCVDSETPVIRSSALPKVDNIQSDYESLASQTDHSPAYADLSDESANFVTHR